jgi:hypothetical protein
MWVARGRWTLPAATTGLQGRFRSEESWNIALPIADEETGHHHLARPSAIRERIAIGAVDLSQEAAKVGGGC